MNLHSNNPARFVYQHKESPKSLGEHEEVGTDKPYQSDFEIIDVFDQILPEKFEKTMVDYQEYKSWQKAHPSHTPFKTTKEAYPLEDRISEEVMQELESISQDAMPLDCDTETEQYYNDLLFMKDKSSFKSIAEKNYYIEGVGIDDIEHSKVIVINDTHTNQKIKDVFSSLLVVGFDPQKDILLVEGVPLGQQYADRVMTLWPYGTEVLLPQETEGWEIESAHKKALEEIQLLGISSQEQKDTFLSHLNTFMDKMCEENAPQKEIDEIQNWYDTVAETKPGLSEYNNPHKAYEGAIRDRNIGILRAVEQNAHCGRIWIFCGFGHMTLHFKECLPQNTTYLYPKNICTYEELFEMQEKWEREQKYLNSQKAK